MASLPKRTRPASGSRPERTDHARGHVGLQIGRLVRQPRDAQGLTLAEAAASADISPAMLSRIETGRVTPSLETLVSLCGTSAIEERGSADQLEIGARDEREGDGAQGFREASLVLETGAGLFVEHPWSEGLKHRAR
jgi:transcriptional regulator with XRE-family HTH domain